MKGLALSDLILHKRNPELGVGSKRSPKGKVILSAGVVLAQLSSFLFILGEKL